MHLGCGAKRVAGPGSGGEQSQMDVTLREREDEAASKTVDAAAADKMQQKGFEPFLGF